MARHRQKFLNILAFSLLAFALYLNFFYKDPAAQINKANMSTAVTVR